jgi:predicted ester cyclase
VATDLKAIAKRFNDEVMSQGKVDVLDEIVADDYVEHQLFPGIEPTKAGLRQFVLTFREAFPDLKSEVIAMVVEGDEVWVHSAFTGTHKGELMGIPPTGKKVTVAVMDRVRTRDGKAVEHWGLSDDVGMMTQLGVMPEMG